MNNVFIIAEAGDNHNGDINLAYQLIDAAKKAGSDAVKFQTFKTENVITVNAKMADYQIANTNIEESQYDMVKRLELSFQDFKKLKSYCDRNNIKFLTTAFDIESLNFIVDDLRVDTLKIPSGEITNLPYLIACAKTGLPILLSTGMSDMKEIQECMNYLKKYNAGKITLLHCTTEYPAPKNQVNLNAMVNMGKEFACEYGYSDHTIGIEISLAAVAMGAKIIEKHFTLDKDLPGPDHKASLNVEELKQLVINIRNVQAAMGNGVKVPAVCEIKNKSIARKSIVASKDIKAGEILNENNITSKRPGNGINPMRWFEVLGTKAIKDFNKDDLLEI